MTAPDPRIEAAATAGVGCDGECDCWHPEGQLNPGWTATIQEDRIVILCPKCEEFWREEEGGFLTRAFYDSDDSEEALMSYIHDAILREASDNEGGPITKNVLEVVQIVWEALESREVKPSMHSRPLTTRTRSGGPRPIETEAELDTLPIGTVVLSKAYQHHIDNVPVSFQRWPDGRWYRGARSSDTHPDVFLPAIVIHEPTP